MAGHERFKALVAELRMFLEDAHTRLTELETSLPFQVVHGEVESPARSALIESLQREFVPTVVRYSEDIDVSLRSATPQDMQALKEYALRQLHPFLMQSPWMHRSTAQAAGLSR